MIVVFEHVWKLRDSSNLIGDITFARLVGITLALIDDRLHNPLVIERGKPGRFVVQTMHVLVGTVWLHLEVYKIWKVRKNTKKMQNMS